jgi:hypothetical protein
MDIFGAEGEMNYKHNCATCKKEVDLGQSPVPAADALILFNFRTFPGNQNAVHLICSKECQLQYIRPIHGCVVCGRLCAGDKWYVHVKFVNLGGWTSVRAACAETCHKTILREDTGEIDFRYACWFCKKMSETKPKRCAKCRLAYYCNQECQKQHWPTHKHECK